MNLMEVITIKYKFGVLLLMIVIMFASFIGEPIYSYARINRNYESVLEEFNDVNAVVTESICRKSITLLKLGMLTFTVGILFVYAIYLRNSFIIAEWHT